MHNQHMRSCNEKNIWVLCECATHVFYINTHMYTASVVRVEYFMILRSAVNGWANVTS